MYCKKMGARAEMPTTLSGVEECCQSGQGVSLVNGLISLAFAPTVSPLLHDNLQPPVIMYGADQQNGDAFGPLRIIFMRME